VRNADALRGALRRALVEQAGDVVEALHRWSGFARRGTWGMLTSAWASQFTAIAEPRDDQRGLVPELDAFFAGHDIVAAMRPRLHAVSVDGATHLYQRRASCCRLYLVPGGELCASCRSSATTSAWPATAPGCGASCTGARRCLVTGDAAARQKLFLAIFSCAPGTSISAAEP
jgi:hypothetical protein